MGAVTRLPRLRETVLLCFGEDEAQWQAAQGHLPVVHRHRGHVLARHGRFDSVLAPYGPAAVEAVLWEVAKVPRRMIGWGTAAGPPGPPFVVDPAHDLKGRTWRPRWPTRGGHQAAVVSVPFFYQAGPAAAAPAYRATAHDRQVAAGVADKMVDMESAWFYAACGRFAPEAMYVYVRATANRLGEPEAMASGAPGALSAAFGLALRLEAGG